MVIKGVNPTFVNIWRSREGRAGTGGQSGHIKIRVWPLIQALALPIRNSGSSNGSFFVCSKMENGVVGSCATGCVNYQ